MEGLEVERYAALDYWTAVGRYAYFGWAFASVFLAAFAVSFYDRVAL
jgi:hypothetical protein